MPQVSRFFGITIHMYYGNHPPPHFHAEHRAERATFDFSGNLLRGSIASRTARRLIRQWAAQRQRELMLNLRNIERGRPLDQIAPLE
jgi:hypothetical protein